MKHLALIALVFTLTACTAIQPVPGTSDDRLIAVAIKAGSMYGCSKIHLASQPQTSVALAEVEALLNGNPTAAYTRLAQLAGDPGLAWIWSAIHQELDARYDLTATEWTDRAIASLRLALEGCRAGMKLASASYPRASA